MLKPFFVLFLVSLILAGCGDTSTSSNAVIEQMHSTPVEPPRPIADFTLPSHTGQPLSLSELQGKIVLIYFGYTFCPDVCPATLAEFVHVKRALGDDADKVAFVFISVDAERDTPEVLARYMQAFDTDFIALQGDDRTLRKISNDFGLYYQKRTVEDSSVGYLVDHSAATYMLDDQGRMIFIYSFGTPPELITSDIRTVLTAK